MLDYEICRKCKKESKEELKHYRLSFSVKGECIGIRVVKWSCPVVDGILDRNSKPPLKCLYRIEQLMKAQEENGIP